MNIHDMTVMIVLMPDKHSVYSYKDCLLQYFVVDKSVETVACGAIVVLSMLVD